MAHSGFRRILICNGHGGNGAVQQFAQEWAADHPGCRVLFHNWWNAPQDLGQGAGDRSRRVARLVDGELSLDAAPGRRRCPTTQRPMVDMEQVRMLDPVALRAYIGDGNFGGLYQRSDDDMLALWQVAVEETRALLAGSWGGAIVAAAHDALSRLGRRRDRRHPGRLPRARRPRRDPGRHRRRARRRDQSRTASRSPGRSTSSRTPLPAFTPGTLQRHVGHDHPRHQGAPHRRPPPARCSPI